MSKDSKMNERLAEGTLKTFQITEYFSHYSDISSRTDQQVIGLYCNGMVESAQLNEYLPSIFSYLLDPNSKMEASLPPFVSIYSYPEMIQHIFSGYAVFYKEGECVFHVVDMAKIPQRQPEESKVDISVKGPKDSFTEEVNTNISLIRKRLKTPELYSQSYTLGSLSHTNVTLLYLANKANPEMIREVEHRLKTFRTESVTSSGQLEEWLSNKTFSLFPLFDYISRPDYAVECLLRGRFVLVVNGSPLVLIGPANLFLLLKSPEDHHFPYYFVIFNRMLRLIGLLIAIFLPGFWVAVSSINMGQIPLLLIATISINRTGLPIPVATESFLVLLFFELLREATLRMPAAAGQTVSIVGGLIIGDAAIRAGLSSPTLIVATALTAVCTFTLVNQSLTGTVTILRFFVLLLSSFFGIYGLFFGVLSILAYVCRLESFSLSYTEPFSSLTFKEFISALSLNPFNRKKFSAQILKRGKNK